MVLHVSDLLLQHQIRCYRCEQTSSSPSAQEDAASVCPLTGPRHTPRSNITSVSACSSACSSRLFRCCVRVRVTGQMLRSLTDGGVQPAEARAAEEEELQRSELFVSSMSYLSVCLHGSQSTCLSVYLSVSLPVCQSTCLPTCLSAFMF